MGKHDSRPLRVSCQLFAVACILIGFACCTTKVEVQSAKAPSLTEPMDKLFVILNGVDPFDAPTLIKALEVQFSQTQAEAKLRVIDSPTSDDKAHSEELSAYRPDGVLVISPAGGVRTAHHLAKAYYDVSLFDPAKSKRLWRAQIDVSGSVQLQHERMEMLARELVKRLREDRVVKSDPKPKAK